MFMIYFFKGNHCCLSIERCSSLNGLIDEVRLHLASAQMTSFTYDPLVCMTSQTDAGGLTIYYEYDGFQRIKNVYDLSKEGCKALKRWRTRVLL